MIIIRFIYDFSSNHLKQDLYTELAGILKVSVAKFI